MNKIKGNLFVDKRKVDRLILEVALKESWCKDTSADPKNWTKDNPTWGQCAVTALIVNDYFGGEIVWAEAVLPNGRKISHYFNKINDKEIDITRSQFPENTFISKGIPKLKEQSTTRDYVISFPATQHRYELLKNIVENNLNSF